MPEKGDADQGAGMDHRSLIPGGFSRWDESYVRTGLFSFSLRWKVALSFSVLLIMVVGTLFLAFMQYEWMFLSREARKRAQSSARNMAVNARDPLLALDELRFGPITESVKQDPEVRYAYLMDHQGKVVYHSDPSKTGMVFSQGVPDSPGGIIQASVPVEVEKIIVGTAVVGLGVEHIKQAMVTTAAGLLLPLGIGAVVGVLGIFLLTGIHVRRIEKLEKAVRALGSGNLRVRVEDAGTDEVGRLGRHFNDMVAQLDSSRSQIEKNFKETISALAEAVEAKDKYTRGHCERVAGISVAMGRELHLGEEQIGELEMAAILHDIGKIGVKAGIVGKMGPLTYEEAREMKNHPEIGARILNPLSSLQNVALFVRHHHEHFDGSGYPRGLEGDQIPLASRIILLVDAFDAMTTGRPYREALTMDEAFGRIRDGSGKQFDSKLVDLFFKLEKNGTIHEVCREVQQSDE